MNSHVTTTKRCLPYAAIVLASLLLTAPLASWQSWPAGHDGLRYHRLLQHFCDCFQHGFLYPRFLPNAFGGYGYPTFLFYQPGFFYIAMPFVIVTRSVVFGIYLTILSLFIAGGVGTHKLCCLIGDTATALFCAGLFVITPYVHVNLYIRNDLSELAAMLLSPWPLYWLMRLHRATEVGESCRSEMTTLGMSIALIILTHPATSLFFVPALIIVGAYLAIRTTRPGLVFLVRGTVSLLLGIILASPYWVTLFQMKSYVAHSGATHGYFTASDHVVYPAQLFATAWEGGASVAGRSDHMPFQLGFVHFLLALIGFGIGRHLVVIQAAFILYITLVLCMLPWSSWIWDNVPMLSYVQFPWRILSVTAVFQAACAGGISRSLCASSSKRLFILVVLFLLCLLWNYRQFTRLPKLCERADVELEHHRRDWLTEFHTYASAEEFTPHTALQASKLSPRGDRPLVVASDEKRALQPLPGSSPFFIRYYVGAGPAVRITINQIYIPGWCVKIRGERVSTAELEQHISAHGLIGVRLPESGPLVLDAYYDGPPFRTWRNSVILFFIVAFAIFCVRQTSIRQEPVSVAGLDIAGRFG